MRCVSVRPHFCARLSARACISVAAHMQRPRVCVRAAARDALAHPTLQSPHKKTTARVFSVRRACAVCYAVRVLPRQSARKRLRARARRCGANRARVGAQRARKGSRAVHAASVPTQYLVRARSHAVERAPLPHGFALIAGAVSFASQRMLAPDRIHAWRRDTLHYIIRTQSPGVAGGSSSVAVRGPFTQIVLTARQIALHQHESTQLYCFGEPLFEAPSLCRPR